MDAHVESRPDVFARTFAGPFPAVLQDERFETANGVERAIGVAGGERSAVAGVHCSQHVEYLGATNLPDNESIRAQTKRGPEQRSNRYLAVAFELQLKYL